MSELVQDVSAREFEDVITSSTVPVVVDFWAPWCAPCRMLAPEVDKLASNTGDSVKFMKLNVDDNREIAMRYEVMSIPTVAKFEGGRLVARVVGARDAKRLGAELGVG